MFVKITMENGAEIRIEFLNFSIVWFATAYATLDIAQASA